MTADSTSLLQKQQNKLPTSMRYERVQDMLQNDLYFKTRLSARTQPIDTRFGEKLLFSKEVIEVTEAIHAEGKDAHKVSKNELFRVAMRVMKITPFNGEIRNTAAQTQQATAPTQTTKTDAPPVKIKAVSTKRSKAKKAHTSKPQPVSKPASKPEPVKAETKPAKAVKVPRKSKSAKSEPVKVSPVKQPSRSNSQTAEETKPRDDTIPESELPPERQPLHLPVEFDTRKYPHYNVQTSIYSMLLSALNLSEHFEKLPGFEERQQLLEVVVKKYLDTCDLVNGPA